MKRPSLANAELAVMELLWQQDRLTARHIREELYPDATRPQHGTVQRLLQRLEDKGFVEWDDGLPMHFFSALISREAYACSQLESLADKLTGGSLAPLITHLMEQKKISHAEIERLGQILDEGAADTGKRAWPISCTGSESAASVSECPRSRGVGGSSRIKATPDRAPAVVARAREADHSTASDGSRLRRPRALAPTDGSEAQRRLQPGTRWRIGHLGRGRDQRIAA